MMKPILLTLTCVALAATAEFAAQEKSGTPPTDPQIAMIAVTADTIDIDAGKLAAEKTTNPKVKDLAELMVRDHTSVNNQATALAQKLNPTPQESATSQALKADGDKEATRLKGLTATAFDKAYVDNEVAYHEKVLGAVDNTLIPNAKTQSLRTCLKARDRFLFRT
jgi:putative membrane protein